jgi:hypothetical protein
MANSRSFLLDLPQDSATAAPEILKIPISSCQTYAEIVRLFTLAHSFVAQCSKLLVLT